MSARGALATPFLSPFFQGLSRLERPEPNGNRRIPGWLEELRGSAFQWVSEHGFPTKKDEAWKYTKLAPILDVAFARAERETSRRLSFRAIDQLVDDLGGARLVVVNGFFAPELSSFKSSLTGGLAAWNAEVGHQVGER